MGRRQLSARCKFSPHPARQNRGTRMTPRCRVSWQRYATDGPPRRKDPGAVERRRGRRLIGERRERTTSRSRTRVHYRVADPLQGAPSAHASAVGAPLQGAWLVEPGDCATSWRGGNSIFWSFIIFLSVAIVFCVSPSHWPSTKASATGIPSLLDHMYEYAWLSAWQYWMSEGAALAMSCWAVAAKGRPNARLVIKQTFTMFMAFHS